MIEHQLAEQQQQAHLAQQAAGSSTVISAGHLAAGSEVASSPQRNYFMWKDSLQQPQQAGKFVNILPQKCFEIFLFRKIFIFLLAVRIIFQPLLLQVWR